MFSGLLRYIDDKAALGGNPLLVTGQVHRTEGAGSLKKQRYPQNRRYVSHLTRLSSLSAGLTNRFLQAYRQPKRRWWHVMKTHLTVSLLLVPILALPIDSIAQASSTCPLQGDTKIASIERLNVLKNRTAAPASASINPQITLVRVLKPGDDRSRWDNSDGAVITGYVIDVHPGGYESVNCHAHNLSARDSHIDIAATPGAPKTAWMVVEVTPRVRAMMAARGVDWSTRTLEKTLPGHWVTFTGWMLFDMEHANASENTAPGSIHDWRATSWEIHPVTAISIVSAPATSAPTPQTY